MSPLTGYETKALRPLLREVHGRQLHRILVAIEGPPVGHNPPGLRLDKFLTATLCGLWVKNIYMCDMQVHLVFETSEAGVRDVESIKYKQRKTE